jgi:hypothetical protein
MRSALPRRGTFLAVFLLVGCTTHQRAGTPSYVDAHQRNAYALVDSIEIGQSAEAMSARFANDSSRDRPYQVQLAMAGTLPTGPNPKCTELLGKIMSFLFGSATNVLGGVTFTGIDMHHGLLERHEALLLDKEDLYKKYRSTSTPHPGGKGSWNGHVDQYKGQQAGLTKLLQQWNDPRNGCNGDGGSGLPQERFRVIQLAAMWAIAPAPSQPRLKSTPASTPLTSTVPVPIPDPTPSQTPAPTTQSSGADTKRITKALVIIGVSAGLAIIVAAAILDPEPISKLTLAGLSAQQAATLLILLGITAEVTTAGYPVRDAPGDHPN